jgi:hypothetical protein
MNIYDKTVAGVGETKTINGSLILLLNNLAAEIRGVAGNQDATLGLADMVASEAPRLSATILANTPMIEATPPVHPMPDSAGGHADHLDVSSMTGKPEEIASWQKEHPEVHEIDRDAHADGTVTAYFRPLPKGAEPKA